MCGGADTGIGSGMEVVEDAVAWTQEEIDYSLEHNCSYQDARDALLALKCPCITKEQTDECFK